MLCSQPVMRSIILHTRRPNCQYKICYALGFYVSAIFFFRILRSWKHVFHIAPFCPTTYVLKSFKWLEVSNRERNWNKLKNVIYVCSKLQLFQLEIQIFIYKFMWEPSLINSVSFLFCEFNRLASWNQGKTYFSTIIISNYQKNTGFIYKVNVCHCKYVFS